MRQRLELWQRYQTGASELGAFLGEMEGRLAAGRASGEEDLGPAEARQSELEAAAQARAPAVERLGREAAEVLGRSEGAEKVVLTERLEELTRRWKAFTAGVAAGRAALEERAASDESLRADVGEASAWVEDTAALLRQQCEPSDRLAMERHAGLLADRWEALEGPRKAALEALEKRKGDFVELDAVPLERKHEARQALASLSSRFYRFIKLKVLMKMFLMGD